LEELPTDDLRGVDFRIAKTSKGGFADYSTSKWSRRERSLSEAEQAAIEKYKLFNLSDFLPKKPSEVELKVMKEMFEASVDGEPYDPERWGQYFKPAGFNAGNDNVSNPSSAPTARPAPVPKAVPTPVAETPAWEEDAAEAATVPVAAKPSSQRAEDILAMIRSRQK